MELSKIKNTRQALFGFSALWIALFHTYDLRFGIKPLDVFMNTGDIGVEIFLFLSGVGLFQSMQHCNSLKEFYSRRFRRITPAIVITAFIKHVLLSTDTMLKKMINMTVFLYFRVGWFFQLLVFIYVAFPLIYQIVIRYREKAVLLLTAGDVLVCFLLAKVLPGLYRYSALLATRIPIFLIGTLFGVYISETRKISKKWIRLCWIIMGLCCCTVFCYAPLKDRWWKPFVYYFLSISMILTISNISIPPVFRPIKTGLEHIGSYSMEIYLLYEMIWSLCKRSFKGYIESDILYFGILLVITFVSVVMLKLLSNKVLAIFTDRRVPASNT